MRDRCTKLCDTLGIEFPIIAFTHCKDVAAAVITALPCTRDAARADKLA
jgi:hypothetical protein